jgi:hypothetical protein
MFKLFAYVCLCFAYIFAYAAYFCLCAYFATHFIATAELEP